VAEGAILQLIHQQDADFPFFARGRKLGLEIPQVLVEKTLNVTSFGHSGSSKKQQQYDEQPFQHERLQIKSNADHHKRPSRLSLPLQGEG
jgi:hypothetical protein